MLGKNLALAGQTYFPGITLYVSTRYCVSCTFEIYGNAFGTPARKYPPSSEIVFAICSFVNRPNTRKEHTAPIIVRGIYKNPCAAEIRSYRVLQEVGCDGRA